MRAPSSCAQVGLDLGQGVTQRRHGDGEVLLAPGGGVGGGQPLAQQGPLGRERRTCGTRQASQPMSAPTIEADDEQCDLHGAQRAAGVRQNPGPTRRTLEPRESHHRHRRAAQRREVDAVQRPDQERRARRELPLRDDRAQRRGRRRARSAAGRARQDPCLGEADPRHRVLRRHRRHRARRVRGRGPGQQVPRQHPRERRDLPGDQGVPRSQRRARRRPGLAQGRHRDHQHRADPRRSCRPSRKRCPASRKRCGSTRARPRW